MASTPQPKLGEDIESAAEPSTENAAGVGGTDVEFRTNTSSEYLRAWFRKMRSGESGMLPVIGGLIIIGAIFQSQKSVFLSAGNITNLLELAASVYIFLGMAEVFVLLLGEIDLSLGFVAANAAVVTVATSQHQPWWLAVIFGLVFSSVACAIQGALITWLKLPSFVVTLAGLLGFEGLLLYLSEREGGATGGGTIRITNNVIDDFVNGNLSPVAGWIVMLAAVVVYAVLLLLSDQRRRAGGLVTPPMIVSIGKIALAAAAGIALVAICNANRGRNVPVRGVPWVIPIVLGVLVLWGFLLGRTRFGRYVYAIGGNPEAARRAGINLSRIRLLSFTLGGLTAGIAGIMYASRLGSISNNVNGGQLVLYAVAAAVIGGTSLFGGRGKIVHALLGGVVVATIDNGMALIGLKADAQDMVTALVLLAAVTLDAVARRGRTTA